MASAVCSEGLQRGWQTKRLLGCASTRLGLIVHSFGPKWPVQSAALGCSSDGKMPVGVKRQSETKDLRMDETTACGAIR